MKDKKTEVKQKIGATIEQLNEWYDSATAYQKQLGLIQTIPECVRFYEGEQWPKTAKGTEHFPRPVVNIIKMTCNNKKAQVLSSPVKITYKNSHLSDVDVEKFNHFAQYQLTRLQQERFNNMGILDGMIKGNWCYYYYWDTEVVGVDGLKEGDIGIQIIDPYNVKFANPAEKDEQKQEWIMLISRESVDKVKKIADKGIDLSLIKQDDIDSIYGETESETTKFVTVMTRFFRHNGEVYYERATQNVVFNEARPFTPDPNRFKSLMTESKNGKEGTQRNNINADNSYLRSPKITKYPIVFESWEERDKSIYGRSEVETMISNQKAINWTLGLQILIAQNEGMSPVIVAPDALKGQTITNEPGEIITDYSKTGNGVKFPGRPTMNMAGVNLVDKIADLTRIVCGSSEVMSGELVKSGMSGAAIAQLQAQALKPIENFQKKHWRVMERVGEILEQYFKFFYKNKKFQHRDEEGKIIDDNFDSETYKNSQFDVSAEAVAGTIMSEVADINVLETLFAKGALSAEEFINCYPDNALSNREKLIKGIQATQQNQLTLQTQQIQHLSAQVQKMQAVLKEQEQTINNANTVISENINLKERLYSLQAEYINKLKQANALLYGIVGKSKEFREDATVFAEELAKMRGINPTEEPMQKI